MLKMRVMMAALLAGLLGTIAGAAQAAETKAASPLDYRVKDIDGKEIDLSKYKGKVVMVVNVASRCGLTPQYEGLQKVYEQYREKGFVVVGFPANDFKGQEPGSNEQIKEFCTSKYNVTFPMMSKVTVLGEGKAPVYRHLTEEATAGAHAGEIKWNFTKFLIGKDGKVAARFEPKVKPTDEPVVEAIEKALRG